MMRINSGCSRSQMNRALSQWEDNLLAKHLEEDEDDKENEDFDEDDFDYEDDFEEVEGDEE